MIVPATRYPLHFAHSITARAFHTISLPSLIALPTEKPYAALSRHAIYSFPTKKSNQIRLSGVSLKQLFDNL